MENEKISTIYDNQKGLRIGLLIIADAIVLFLSYFFAYYLVYSFHIPFGEIQALGWTLALAIVLKLAIFWFTRMYQTLWRYASIEELWQIVGSVASANFITVVFFYIVSMRIPTTVLVLTFIFDLILIGGIRILYRSLRQMKNGIRGEKHRVLIVGAGEAGIKMLREINNSRKNLCVTAFIDDDPNKKGRMLNGVKVIGGRDKIQEAIQDPADYEEIIIAMPTAPKRERIEIAEICHATGVPVKILPTIEEILEFDISQQKLRDLQIEDLLDRDEVHLDKTAISQTISGKTVLITGGAGSIGSELARQIIRFHPKELIIIDINENALYYLELELTRYINETLVPQGYPVKLITRIASIREREIMDEHFRLLKPQIVFHAAAHKHVPLMERTPREAVRNNVFGTRNVLEACVNNGVDRFVQISTDKAVNPTNVMGATKRICEQLTQIYNGKHKTDCVAVRFGNVLGSNGSVIPIFKEQIAAGGPVTVTHKDITRFFMTIPEATQLVLQAASMARGGEIFVLDMGEPVKITDLAEKMIALAGYEPYTEIPIRFVGLRPGEKLYEELSCDMDAFDRTTFESISVEKPVAYDVPKVEEALKNLKALADGNDDKVVVEGIQVLVPEFTPDIEKED
ncbi:NDP-sugar epimerase, includes UDP-GlcNAc-inverting 4,6-dehydratase FlaA1 and capsular polysaccharide biosynthesis protein EpsC [Eubacterium aggregans]|uniref:NDP-sugar epimerase, includes UDP-GlcNAc-inverting 4,6-dehydratase FlaA1 and capsular polysaccharide biosynthesis protein EpsC n=1 Tax=Eubacterium aggregans TaxID=81409 RepID=A0A1H3YA77_9FIRM|nr:nucleoside-diphosphate sugar epimerase/dehydratase [Eubacterium aggregans]SEA07891.1 NDP-sugar epimerase, includes UDP-GlcNAc-inverting 4,6-dehydratase FlaA1 and capsular polysaccharide biosynthesis protein EpsC [Eubacterium aggregans]